MTTVFFRYGTLLPPAAGPAGSDELLARGHPEGLLASRNQLSPLEGNGTDATRDDDRSSPGSD